jgi:hypothetical protein
MVGIDFDRSVMRETLFRSVNATAIEPHPDAGALDYWEYDVDGFQRQLIGERQHPNLSHFAELFAHSSRRKALSTSGQVRGISLINNVDSA